MTKVNDPIDRSPRDPGLPEGKPEWSIRLGQVRGVSVALSCTVFLAAAGLVAAITVSGSGGNAEVAKAAGMGAAIWMGGWLIQALVAAGAAAVLGLRLRGLTIGLIGLETPPHFWNAVRSLAWSTLTLSGLLVAGGLFWCYGGEGSGGNSAPLWHPPSLGLTAADSIPRAAAWLLWIQAVCQLFPLPGTLGRITVISLVSLGFPGLADAAKASLARRCMKGFAVLTGFVAVGLFATDAAMQFPRSILLLVLAGALWISARSHDLRELIERFHFAADGVGLDEQGATVVDRVRRWSVARRRRQRLVATAKEERQEAVDAARLDAILEQLCRDGVDSLSEEERGVLKRVSERLRRVRKDDAG